MKERMTQALAAVMVLIAAIAVWQAVGVTPARGEGTTPTSSGNPPFVCQSGCDCEIPKAGTVFCIENPYICETITSQTECDEASDEAYFYGEIGWPGPAYVALNTGKKPSGCKSETVQTNCGEESFECYRKGYCEKTVADNCATSAFFQGPANQANRKKAVACGAGS